MFMFSLDGELRHYTVSLILRERAVCDVDAVVGGAYFVVVGIFVPKHIKKK